MEVSAKRKMIGVLIWYGMGYFCIFTTMVGCSYEVPSKILYIYFLSLMLYCISLIFIIYRKVFGRKLIFLSVICIHVYWFLFFYCCNRTLYGLFLPPMIFTIPLLHAFTRPKVRSEFR